MTFSIPRVLDLREILGNGSPYSRDMKRLYFKPKHRRCAFGHMILHHPLEVEAMGQRDVQAIKGGKGFAHDLFVPGYVAVLCKLIRKNRAATAPEMDHDNTAFWHGLVRQEPFLPKTERQGNSKGTGGFASCVGVLQAAPEILKCH